MDEEQEKKLRKFIEGWLARNPDVHDVSAIRLADLSSVPGSKAAGLGTPTDVLRSMGLDLFGGIDPAVAEVQRSRLLAERAFYFAKRWPRILELQTRLLTLQLAAQPGAGAGCSPTSRGSRWRRSRWRGRRRGCPRSWTGSARRPSGSSWTPCRPRRRGPATLLAEMRRTLDAGTGAANAVHGALGSLDAILAADQQAQLLPGRRPRARST